MLATGVGIDAFIRISRVGIELAAIARRAVVGSVETWPPHAKARGLSMNPAAA
ncbi:gas vesicle synthesis protein GvpA [Rhodobacteraceae bacterium CYK-10]|uniref:Gas vesicle synthesis protein GvpA n=1 Tax=Stagnihabitans tardus TaxID=2699202 RepID=A0AAE4YFG7_9RHOB|nr:gas vesicle synthesis protein GvpA [Stagnihabitans tardus]